MSMNNYRVSKTIFLRERIGYNSQTMHFRPLVVKAKMGLKTMQFSKESKKMQAREFFLSLCDTRICSFYLGEDDFYSKQGSRVHTGLSSIIKGISLLLL